MSEPVESGAEAVAESEVAAELSCGERLKAARERLGMTHTDVAQRLKYAARQVQALEEGKFDTLPGLTFQRGFVRGYAKLVGLDPNEMVARLEYEVGRDGGPTTTQLQQIVYTPALLPSQAASTSAWPWIFGMILAIVGIGGYTLYEWESPARNAKSGIGVVLPTPVPQTPTPTAVTENTGERLIPLPQPAADVLPSGTGDVVSAPAAASVAGVAPGTGKIHLSFSGESWVEVRQANGSIAFSGMNSTGTEQWVDGQPPFDLVVGNARAVKLVYRGAEVNLEPYTKVTVARLQLK
jgi:cytoskeleton protein RodZ